MSVLNKITVGSTQYDIEDATAAKAASLASVATSGSYDDLDDKPTIPAAQIQADWDQSDNTAKDFIKNKPTLGTAAAKDSTNAVTANSTDLVESGAVKTAIDGLETTVTEVNSKIGDITDLETTDKTDVVSAINEIVSKIQSRPIVTVKTRTSSNSESRLTPSDVESAGFSLPVGSYLVTVYRNTSSSLTYFIGWVWSTNTFDDSNFNKVAGEGTSLIVSGEDLVYNGGDTDSNIEVTWIFQPIGDSHCDN